MDILPTLPPPDPSQQATWLFQTFTPGTRYKNTTPAPTSPLLTAFSAASVRRMAQTPTKTTFSRGKLERRASREPNSLQTSDGRTLVIEMTPKPTICVKHTQRTEGIVKVHHIKGSDNNTHVAFCFQKNTDYYYPFVKDSKLKLQKVGLPKTPRGKEFEFKWNSETLESVAQPNWFWVIDKNKVQVQKEKKETFRWIKLYRMKKKTKASNEAAQGISCVKK
nr:PREDICTED: uncharacterized protein LOC107079270 [Lepisosteus oculatus]